MPPASTKPSPMAGASLAHLYTTVMAGANSTRQDSIFHVVAEIIRGLVLGLGHHQAGAMRFRGGGDTVPARPDSPWHHAVVLLYGQQRPPW
jgi:hypothetical protein